MEPVLLFFSCPDESLRQLYTYPCHSLQTYKDLLLFDIKGRPWRLVTCETYDQSDEETWPDQPKDNYSNNDKDKDKDKYIDHERDMTWCMNLREIVYI